MNPLDEPKNSESEVTKIDYLQENNIWKYQKYNMQLPSFRFQYFYNITGCAKDGGKWDHIAWEDEVQALYKNSNGLQLQPWQGLYPK